MVSETSIDPPVRTAMSEWNEAISRVRACKPAKDCGTQI